MCDNGCAPGGSDVSLTYPRTVQRIQGDLYRALVYAITGSERQHYRLRCLIVEVFMPCCSVRKVLFWHGQPEDPYEKAPFLLSPVKKGKQGVQGA